MVHDNSNILERTFHTFKQTVNNPQSPKKLVLDTQQSIRNGLVSGVDDVEAQRIAMEEDRQNRDKQKRIDEQPLTQEQIDKVVFQQTGIRSIGRKAA